MSDDGAASGVGAVVAGAFVAGVSDGVAEEDGAAGGGGGTQWSRRNCKYINAVSRCSGEFQSGMYAGCVPQIDCESPRWLRTGASGAMSASAFKITI